MHFHREVFYAAQHKRKVRGNLSSKQVPSHLRLCRSKLTLSVSPRSWQTASAGHGILVLRSLSKIYDLLNGSLPLALAQISLASALELPCVENIAVISPRRHFRVNSYVLLHPLQCQSSQCIWYVNQNRVTLLVVDTWHYFELLFSITILPIEAFPSSFNKIGCQLFVDILLTDT